MYQPGPAITPVPAKSPQDHLRGPRPTTATRFGFTLIELLVVVAIIAILASLLLPALSRAKAQANSVACRTNLRQLGIATRMYLDDFNAFPLFYDHAANNEARFWSSKISPYISSGWKDRVFHCPGNRQTNSGGFVVGSSIIHLRGSYDMNLRGSGAQIPLGIGDVGSGGPFGQRPVPESEVIAPSSLLAFGDTIMIDAYLIFSFFDLVNYLRPSVPNAIARRRAEQRHGGTYSVVFVDGHTESRKPALLFGERPDLLRQWNRDNEPHLELLRP
ncbi:MAG TPA: prepilin-type N-terminal cleavage/methylation domain-containing protein [Fimbriimonadaceae bacterium]|nr:prepilin-type N-terminal cleavage/methylation domain-containing protein [Fimbriimonadaceae bacterium]